MLHYSAAAKRYIRYTRNRWQRVGILRYSNDEQTHSKRHESDMVVSQSVMRNKAAEKTLR